MTHKPDLMDDPRTVVIPWADWDGFRNDDQIVEITPERKIFVRNGVVHVVVETE